MRRISLSILLLICSLAALSQSYNAADSLRFVTAANWKELSRDNEVVVKELRSEVSNVTTHLFGHSAHIYVMEIPAYGYRLQPVQLADKERTSDLQKALNGLASVNGGFFVVKPDRRGAAVANDFLKINGRVVSPDPSPGWGLGAVAVDSSGKLHFTFWNKSMDADTVEGWSARFPNVMVAGPMLILDGKTVTNPDPSRHPRTAIGTRPDGTIVLIVIDGRRRRAAGATFSEMSAMGRWLGLENMLNLDGGGSSTMVFGRRVVNFPSDGQGIVALQRRVANALVLLQK